MPPKKISKNQAKKKQLHKLQEKRQFEKTVSKQLRRDVKRSKAEADRKVVEEYRKKVAKEKGEEIKPKKHKKRNPNKISAEDKEFLSEYGSYVGLVSQIDTGALKEIKKPGKKRPTEKNEESYEKKPRKYREDEEEKISLPIISHDGTVISQNRGIFTKPKLVKDSSKSKRDNYGVEGSERDEADSDLSEWSDVENNSGDETDGITRTTSKKKEAKNEKKEDKLPKQLKDLQEQITGLSTKYNDDMPLGQKALYINVRKQQLASLSSVVIENPELNVKMLRNMAHFCQDPNLSVRKLSFLTFFAVFKDIMPDYRIRELSEEELKIKVSKEVRVVRDFEAALLKHYLAYLKLAEETLKKSIFPSEKLSLLTALCQLLGSNPHFNYATNIMDLLVPQMNSKTEEISKTCCQLFQGLLESDRHMEISFNLVKRISNYVKENNFAVNPETLQVLLHLKIHEDMNEEDLKALHPYASQTKKKDTLSRKMKKKMKIEKELEKDLMEAEADVNRADRKKKQMEIMKMIFLIYFRVLKASKSSSLLSPVLDGLAQFSHLISIDYLSDLLVYFKDILSQHLPVHILLKCVRTTFQLMSGQGSALIFDLSEFYTAIYEALPYLAHVSVQKADGELFITVLKTILLERKQVSSELLASFVKRMGSVAIHTSTGISMALICISKNLISKYPKLHRLLEYEDSEQFDIYDDNPTTARGLSSAYWETSLARIHYHPHISKASKAMTALPTLNSLFQNMSPEELIGIYSTEEGLFTPDLTIPGPTPLQLRKKNMEKTGDHRQIYINQQKKPGPISGEASESPEVTVPDFENIFADTIKAAPLWTLGPGLITARMKALKEGFLAKKKMELGKASFTSPKAKPSKVSKAPQPPTKHQRAAPK